VFPESCPSSQEGERQKKKNGGFGGKSTCHLGAITGLKDTRIDKEKRRIIHPLAAPPLEEAGEKKTTIIVVVKKPTTNDDGIGCHYSDPYRPAGKTQ